MAAQETRQVWMTIGGAAAPLLEGYPPAPVPRRPDQSTGARRGVPELSEARLSRSAHCPRTIIGLVALAILLCVAPAWATSSPCSNVGQPIAVGNDFFTFTGVQYDFPAAGQSTWYYEIESGSSPAISHVTFELGLACLDVIEACYWGP